MSLMSCRDRGKNTSELDAKISEIRARAEKGDVQAQTDLGNCYAKGMGIPKDLLKAYEWYSLSAAQSEEQATKNQRMLEIAMTPGEIAEVIRAKEGLLRAKAEKGDAKAQADLGLFYAYRLGAPRDDAESVKWFRKAAEQGNAIAQVGLGVCYFEGDGVLKDTKEAVKWYVRAVEQGNAQAQYMLGRCYASGEGVPKNDEIAVKYFSKAADQGNSPAQWQLGHAYVLGKGVPKDWIEAFKWLSLSKKRGDAIAARWLDYAAEQMTPEQIAEAQKRVNEWKPTTPKRT